MCRTPMRFVRPNGAELALLEKLAEIDGHKIKGDMGNEENIADLGRL